MEVNFMKGVYETCFLIHLFSLLSAKPIWKRKYWKLEDREVGMKSFSRTVKGLGK
jgi:hypothetical protein